MAELKPCPFCGAEAEILDIKDEVGRKMFVAECTQCKVYTNKSKYRNRAANHWNNRPIETSLHAEIKARGEEVLELACRHKCAGCKENNELIYFSPLDRWEHIGRGPDNYPCDASALRNDYHEKYGNTPASIFGPDGKGVATGANPGEGE